MSSSDSDYASDSESHVSYGYSSEDNDDDDQYARDIKSAYIYFSPEVVCIECRKNISDLFHVCNLKNERQILEANINGNIENICEDGATMSIRPGCRIDMSFLKRGLFLIRDSKGRARI